MSGWPVMQGLARAREFLATLGSFEEEGVGERCASRGGGKLGL